MSKGDDHEHGPNCDHGDGHGHGDAAAHAHDSHDDHGHGGHAAAADAAPEHDLLTKALTAAAAVMLIGIMGWWMTVPLPAAHEGGEHQSESGHQVEPGSAEHH